MIIGIGGYRGVGKTTASRVFTKQGFTSVSFADPLKKICASIVGARLNVFDDPQYKDKQIQPPFIPKGLEFADKLIQYFSLYEVLSRDSENKIRRTCMAKEFSTPRDIVQFVGTEIGRNCIRQSFWTDVFKEELRSMEGQNIVVADIRFPNERMTIDQLGGKLVLIERPGKESGLHASENQIGNADDYDVVFKNDKTIEELLANITSWYGTIKGSE